MPGNFPLPINPDFKTTGTTPGGLTSYYLDTQTNQSYSILANIILRTESGKTRSIRALWVVETTGENVAGGLRVVVDNHVLYDVGDSELSGCSYYGVIEDNTFALYCVGLADTTISWALLTDDIGVLMDPIW